MSSPFFRPPYGRMRSSQAANLQKVLEDSATKIIMWDVLSADFDQSLRGEDCLRNVTRHALPGSIIVFHDSEKAWDRLSFALPRVLEYFAGKEYRFFHL
jgi:peptidoglycan/xylan/chitin deacetylase (PgdA/CDA1 family)